MKLSLIIPYYNTWEETKKLLETLTPQLNEDVEVIIVDDGCDEGRFNKISYSKREIRCIHLLENSGVAGKPRNVGLDHAKGEYIAFIDSDDNVTEDYIERIMKAISSKPDIIFLSWESVKQKIIMTRKPPQWNCSVWCRVYKREIIGNTRFDETLKKAEDWKFNQAIKYRTSVCIRKPIYLYNWGREGSLTNG